VSGKVYPVRDVLHPPAHRSRPPWYAIDRGGGFAGCLSASVAVRDYLIQRGAGGHCRNLPFRGIPCEMSLVRKLPVARSLIVCWTTLVVAACSDSNPTHRDGGGAGDSGVPGDSGALGHGGDSGNADGSAACAIDEPLANTTGNDLSCVGATQPGTTSCTHVTISGVVEDIQTGATPATVEVFDPAGALLAHVDAPDGHYSASVPVGPDGFLGRVLATTGTHWPHDIFELSRPYLGNVTMDLTMISGALITEQFTLLDAGTPDLAKGLLIVRTHDCDRNLLPGATVSIDKPYEKRFFSGPNGLADATLTETTSFAGVIFSNVDPGPVVATMYAATADGGTGSELGRGAGTITAGVFTGVLVDAR
jgi:hypothetical protein